jgi:hypothetical protein
LIVDDFLPTATAQSLRNKIEAHFGDPYSQSAETHMNWNYWYVPKSIHILATVPEFVLGEVLAAEFYSTLVDWASINLGTRVVTPPTLSLYVDGCLQEQHNDATHGRFGYVYSLTKKCPKDL